MQYIQIDCKMNFQFIKNSARRSAKIFVTRMNTIILMNGKIEIKGDAEQIGQG